MEYFSTNNLLISELNMSGEDESRKHCESNLSHEDIKPLCEDDCGKQCSDSNMSGVNITVPVRALKNVPGLESIFAPFLPANVPLPRLPVGSVGEVKQIKQCTESFLCEENKALPVPVNVPSVPGAPVPIVGVSEPGHSDMGRNNTGEETHSESESAPESVPDGVPEENQSDSELVPEMKALKIIEPVPEIQQPLPDIKYQF